MFSSILKPVQQFHIMTLFLFTLISLSIFPQTPKDYPALNSVLTFLSPADRFVLLDEGKLLRFHGNSVVPELLPETSLTAAITRKILFGGLNIGMEGLFFTPVDKLPQKYQSMPLEERRLILYNILRSVSTLKGLEYYSASRGKMRLLFEESWAIASREKRKIALPDPLVSSIPVIDTILIHQKDKSFRNNESTMTFRAGMNAFATDIINLSPMRYKGIIRIASPGNMQIHLIVVPVQEGLLIYGMMSAKTLKVKSFINRARDSFTNRIIVLAGWYITRIHESFTD